MNVFIIIQSAVLWMTVQTNVSEMTWNKIELGVE